MKIEVEVLEDQLELLGKIKSLPKVIREHLGKFPQSFPGQQDELKLIEQNLASLEHLCKEWIFNRTVLNSKLGEIFENIRIVDKNEKVLSDYMIC